METTHERKAGDEPRDGKRLYPEVQDQLALAQREKHRITRCEACGGPEVWSKTHPRLSRCFRCRILREAPIAKPAVSLRRCALCHEQKMTGRPLSEQFCAVCRGLSQRERTRRVRWARERAEGMSISAQETPIESGVAESEILEVDPKPSEGGNGD